MSAVTQPNTNLKLQKEIDAFLDVDGQLYFDFSPEDQKVRLSLITENAEHGQSFLLHSQLSEDREEALQETLDFLKKADETSFIFEVEWYLKRRPEELFTSHFRAESIFEVLEKCYYNANRDELIVTRVERQVEVKE
ncbi:MAG: hypothetical protein AAF740_12760 [Bacteroidota bacterium]